MIRQLPIPDNHAPGRHGRPCSVLRQRRTRRGMALLLVMGLLSIGVALALAMTYGQGTTLRVQSNGSRRDDARQAAMTGLTVALGKMHRSSWVGAGNTLAGTVSGTQTYAVTFTAGDDSLTAASTNYSELPYRVTLLSTGYATDPSNSASPGTYRIRAVVKLVPRALSSEPGFWSTARTFTTYQADDDDFRIGLPVRFQGAVRIQGALRLAESYPSSGNTRYFSDLKLLNDAGSDYRPFTGPVTLPYSSSSSTNLGKLTTQLQITTSDVAASTDNLTLSTWQTTYKLYAGGPTYSMQTVSSSLANTTLTPNTATNPLGIYYCASKITVGSNVNVTGTLFSPVEIEVTGTGVTFNPVSAMALLGSSDPIRLPVVMSNLLTIGDGAGVTINGHVQAGDRFKVSSGSVSTTCNITGRLIAEEIRMDSRTEWSNLYWSWYWYWFSYQLGQPNPETNWVSYMQSLGLSPQANIRVVPDTTNRREFYFQANSNPVYTTASGDAGLYWDLLDWKELGP